MSDNYREAFIEETAELLNILENDLLELENRPQDAELIAKVFRALHTIKGSAGMFGFDEISLLTHGIETVYDQIRGKKFSITKGIIDSTLKASDLIRRIINAGSEESFADEPDYKLLIDEFINLAGINGIEKVSVKATEYSEETLTSYNITFKPSKNIFASGTNPLLLINELMSLGEGFVTTHAGNIPLLDNMNPEECYLWWEIFLTTNKSINNIWDVFIFIESESEIHIQKSIPEANKVTDRISGNKQKHKTIEEPSPQYKNEDIKYEPTEDIQKIKVSSRKPDTDVVSSIRVSADKLDKLVNLVGELVTVQARLTQTAETRKDNELVSISEEVERLTWELRDSALNIRMVPIGTTFNKFNRLVRDLSKELNKEVILITEGADTELDKSLIERLSDPLIHIIRNSIDHGLETPAERAALNKNSKGSIFLSAEHSGTNIEITITDDGAGINKESILQKARERGIISEDVKLSEKEIYDLIFHAGFSTAKAVTNVSGRGVGMDIVKKTIESLHGSVEVFSEENKGTTITLKIPLTLAIIEGLLVSIKDNYFIIPLSYVEECIELTKEAVFNSHGRNIFKVRGELIPYIMLREIFNISGESPDIQQIVVVNSEKIRTGLVVDKVIGEHQTVIKSLGKFYKNVDGISGATILGDGTVALITDVRSLIKEAEINEKREAEHLYNNWSKKNEVLL